MTSFKKQSRDPRDVLYTFYVRKELKQKLDEYSQVNNTRTARVLRELIGNFLRNTKDEK